jgi:hypothetical protein
MKTYIATVSMMFDGLQAPEQAAQELIADLRELLARGDAIPVTVQEEGGPTVLIEWTEKDKETCQT